MANLRIVKRFGQELMPSRLWSNECREIIDVKFGDSIANEREKKRAVCIRFSPARGVWICVT
jgi:hypothetical protein